MKYIGLISDTHCLFDDKLRDFLTPVDEIWHAGDFGNIETADAIAAFKPLKGVYGNIDNHVVRLSYPVFQSFTCEEMTFLMMHIGGYPNHYDLRATALIDNYKPQVFICGHSHILRVMNDKKLNMLVLNPGAAGIQGFHQVRTAVRFRVDKGKIFDMEVGEWKRSLENIG